MITDTFGKPTITDPTLSNSFFQRLVYYNNLDSAPNMVDDDVLDTMVGREMFRAVSSASWEKSDEIVERTFFNQNVMFSGVSAFGKGVYFCTDLEEDIQGYGDMSHSIIMRGKLPPNAKSISYYTAKSKAYDEIRNGTALGKAMARIGNQSDVISTWALAKGYSALDTGTYYCVLTRKDMAMSYVYHKVQSSDRKNVKSNRDWKKMSR